MNAPLRLPVCDSARDAAARLGYLAARALVREATLTPKPGLVDRANSGAHDDMNLSTFLASAKALAPRLPGFFLEGCALAAAPPRLAMEGLRPLGLTCERAMRAATGGVNTHKGAIFAFGLALGASGRLWARGARLDADAVGDEIAAICKGLVARELGEGARATAGAAAFRDHGFPGARGEAEAGYPLVRHVALPALRDALARGAGRDEAMLIGLVALLARASDTNLLVRGGREAIDIVRAGAASIPPGLPLVELRARLAAFDRALIARRLSPGGTADLLALTWFLHRLSQIDLSPRRVEAGGVLAVSCGVVRA